MRVLALLRDLRGVTATLPVGAGQPRGGRGLVDFAASGAEPAPFAPRAVICGAGLLEAELRAAEERMGLRGSIVWTGDVEDPGSVLAAADLLLLPSEWEGLPYAILESMAEGTPVLATPVGGVPEVLNGPLAEGCLPWSLETWSAAARSLLADPRRRAEWRVVARERQAEHAEPAMVEAIFAAYGELGFDAGSAPQR